MLEFLNRIFLKEFVVEEYIVVADRLENLITHVLKQNTIGLPAKSIAKQIREISGEDVRKSDINPILYKNPLKQTHNTLENHTYFSIINKLISE